MLHLDNWQVTVLTVVEIFGNAITKHVCPEAKVSNPSVGLILLWAGNSFRENSKYWQFSQEPDGLFTKYNSEMEKLLLFKYVTCNVRGLGENEE